MQKKTVLIWISVLVILSGIGWFLGHAYVNQLTPALAQSNLPDGNVLKQDLAKENWTFEPVDPAKVTQTILSRNQAIDMANKQFPNLGDTKSIIGITANLGQLSNPLLRASAQAGEKVDTTFLNPRLVWIVTYEGVISQSAGPRGFPHATSNEFDVVLDATTGEQLMTFVWKR